MLCCLGLDGAQDHGSILCCGVLKSQTQPSWPRPTIGTSMIFFKGWAMRVLKDGSPPAGSRGSSRWGFGANLSLLMFQITFCSKKITSNITRGKCPLLANGHACGRPCVPQSHFNSFRSKNLTTLTVWLQFTCVVVVGW